MISGAETRKESSQTRKGRTRERKNDLVNVQRENDRAVDRDLAFAPIAISRSVDLAFAFAKRRSREAPHWSRLCLRRAISPVVEPSHLSLFLLLSIWPDLMIFFSRFCLCFCIEEWIILYIRLATEKMWPDFMIFFLGFVCVSVLRNEWYYIFVWQSRKCDQQVENVFSMVFSRTQPNTRKYFSKYFLKCNQTHENIFLFEK